jgi:5-hydroxyisourate hydrolase
MRRPGGPRPAVQVRLERADGAGWAPTSRGQTDGDEQLRLARDGSTAEFEPGVYRITFATGAYFRALGVASFHPEISITFEITAPDRHYHVPLLLSPFAYASYRGS